MTLDRSLLYGLPVAERDVASGKAWEEFCHRLLALGQDLVGDDFPSGEHDRVEGFKHLANQVACWLTYAVGQSNPATPVFFRHNNLTYRWGGPNVDQNARRAVIDGTGTYRISGVMHACTDFILQVKSGSMHTGNPRIDAEVRATDLGIGPGDSFALVLSASEQPGNWVPIAETSEVVHIRDYYFDWEPVEPAAFVIERLDAFGRAGPTVSAADVSGALTEATKQIEGSIRYWNLYQQERRERQPLNTFTAPSTVAAGVQDVLYSDSYIRLAPGEAMVFAFDARAARYWDAQLYSRAWYEPLDFVTRPTSLNHVLAEQSTDGMFRVVVCGDDPGVANWLDNEGRDEVLATIRFFGASSGPVVDAEVVDTGELARVLPPDTRRVDAVARAAERERRQRHVAWRSRD